jgi:hypothetical protein
VQPLPEYGCVFVKNPKVGTSSVMLWLHRILTGDHAWAPERNMHREHKLPSPRDVGYDAVAKMLSGDAFRFAFVRDPVRRLESAYIDKLTNVERQPRWRTGVQRTLGLTEDPGRVPTLDQFVAAVAVQAPLDMDAHWRPQHLNLMDGLVEYDVVGRLEMFDADLERIREAIGAPRIRLDVRNVSPKHAGSLFDGRPDLLRKVREVYARDLELYGY